MSKIMTSEERAQLIQRYYDGETIGGEAALAEKLLDTDPEAQKLLQSMQSLSNSIRVDIDEAIAREDFSSYWDDIAARLPSSVPTLDDGSGDVVVARGGLQARTRPWWRRAWFGPAFAAAAVAAVVAVAVLPNVQNPSADFGPLSYAVEIEEVESDGPLVIIQEATAAAPSIISFNES